MRLLEAADNGRAGRRSKEDLLRAAVTLADQVSTAAPVRHYAVAHVSMSAVAKVAGVTRGALYRLWPTQQDFWNDLVEVILAGDIGDDASADAPSLPPAPSWLGHGSLHSHVADAAQDLLLLDRSPLVQIGLAGYPGPSTATHALAERRADQVARLGRHISHELHADKSWCLGGLTATDIATAIAAIGNGLPITGRIARHTELSFHHRELAEPPHSVLGVALAAIHANLTRPVRLDTPFEQQAAATVVEQQRWSRLPTRTPRGSGRRREYLQHAVALATDRATASEGLDRALGHVHLDTLARTADVTRRTLSNLWPDQAAFRLDLFSHLLARERQWIGRAISHGTAYHRRQQMSEFDAFLTAGDQLHAALADHLGSVSFLAYAPLLAARKLAVRARQDHDELLDDAAQQVSLLLDVTRRRPRRGVTMRQIALALFTLADGTNRLMRIDPALTRTDIAHDGEKHTITGFATAAILTGLTEAPGVRPEAVDFAALIS